MNVNALKNHLRRYLLYVISIGNCSCNIKIPFLVSLLILASFCSEFEEGYIYFTMLLYDYTIIRYDYMHNIRVSMCIVLFVKNVRLSHCFYFIEYFLLASCRNL